MKGGIVHLWRMFLLKKLTLIIFIVVPINSYAEHPLLTGLVYYQAIEQKKLVSGTFKAKGSSRIEPIVRNLLHDFSRFYSDVSFTVEAGGSGTAIGTLMNDTTHSGLMSLGLMSRKIKASEINQFIDEKGYRPTEIRIALDDLRVIVNRKNPIDQLSLQELDAIFSRSRLCGARYPIQSWEEFGWVAKKDEPSTIDTHIFRLASGARGFFRKTALCNGDYRESSNQLAETNDDMVENVADSITGIGFSALDVNDYRVKTLKISKARSYPAYMPTLENVLNKHYPLSRYLYIYIDKPPKSAMPLAYREFFKFLFSHQGQQIILNNGAIPLRFNIIRDELINVIGEQ